MTPQEINLISSRFIPQYRAFAINLTRDEEKAADLLQEAIYLIVKNHQRFVEGTNLHAWIKTIIRNLFISDYRKEKRRREISEAEVPTTNWSHQSQTANDGETNMAVAEIQEYIDELSPIYRKAFNLYVAGYKYQKIADLTGVPLGTAKSRVFTARRMLRERL